MELIKNKYVLFILLGMFACQTESDDKMIEKYKTEIIETENAFAKLAKEKGVKTAFITYASEEAVLLRGETLIKGKRAIGEHFDSQNISEVVIEWEPDFVNVSSSGDFAYTYGKYSFSAKDENGERIENEGIFHTVWERDPAGKWKFVWD